MRKKLTIPLWSFIFLLLPGRLFAQPVTSVKVRDGKITMPRSKSSITNSGFADLSSGTKRTFIVNGTITLTITTIQPSCGYYNGALIASASGGTAPYTYSVDPGYYFKTGYFPNLPAGNHSLTVTDAAGQTVTYDFVLTNTYPPALLLVLQGAVTRPSGCIASDGSVTLTASGGLPPYEYSIDLVNYQSSNTFSNLTYGYYNFYVRDANGCIARISSSDFSTLFSPFGCDAFLGFAGSETECANDGVIDFSGSSNSSVLTYSVDGVNYNPTVLWEHLGYGVYKIYIKNTYSGKVFLYAISIAHNCYIRLDYISVDAACQQNDGSLTVTASNGTAPYLYTIDGNNFQSSNVFRGLGAGNYNVSVRDANGFTSSLGAVVYDKCPVVSLTSTNESCINNDGTITANAVKGTAPYQYSVDGINFQNSNLFTGLAAGNYTVTLKDALGFMSTGNIDVTFSCLGFIAIPTDATCGYLNGKITITPSSGTAPYLYSINGVTFQTGNIFSGLPAGTYTITVKDATGLTSSKTVDIIDLGNPGINVSSTPALCNNNEGIITITGTNGTPPLLYSLTSINYQASNVFSNLPAGLYNAYVKDANGCMVQVGLVVPNECPAIVGSVTNESCGNANGSISLSLTGNNSFGPYQYSIDGINFQASNTFNGLPAGNYTITVKDVLGYTFTQSVIVNNTCPVVSATATNGTCGNANGMITATGSNGTSPYQYSIDGINFQTNNIFNGLAAGNYTVSIKDAGGSVTTTTISVGNTPGPSLIANSTAATCINNDGTITLSATGGASPLQFAVDGGNFQASNFFSKIISGNHTAMVKDANGCIFQTPVAVGVTDNLFIQIINPSSICEGKSAVLNINSNASTFQWSPASTLNNAQIANPVASPTSSTKYYINASLGICSRTDSVIVNVNPAPIADAGWDTTICFGVSVQLNGSGGLVYNWSPSTYLNNPGVNNPVVTQPQKSVSYNLNVIDANGCKSLSASTIKITVTPPAKIFAGNDTAIAIGQPLQLKAVDVNNSGFVQYSWSPPLGLNNSSIANPVLIGDENITYKITATTQAGCEGSDEINIKVYQGPEIYVPKAFTPNNDGHNDLLRAIPVGIKEFKYFIVYNRWGQKVFFTADSSKGWDGKFNNAMQDVNTFVWISEGIDYKGNIIQRKGTVTLIR